MGHAPYDFEQAGFELAAAAGATVAVALAAAALFPPSEPVASAAVVAAGAGLLAHRITSRAVLAAVLVLTGAIHVGFLVNRYGELTGTPLPWPALAMIAGATLTGQAVRVVTSWSPVRGAAGHSQLRRLNVRCRAHPAAAIRARANG